MNLYDARHYISNLVPRVLCYLFLQTDISHTALKNIPLILSLIKLGKSKLRVNYHIEVTISIACIFIV